MHKKEIIFLGTGAPDATKYFNTCFYIKENSTGILVDTGGGNGILTNLEKANIALKDIKYLFITHKHIDHLLGVFWLLRFIGAKINKAEADKLTIFCSKKIADIIQQVSKLLLKEKVLALFGEKIIFTIIEGEMPIKIDDWNILCINTQSEKEEQLGFRLEFSDEGILVYLGDEPYKESLYEYCKNADYLLHNAFCLEKDRDIFNPQNMHHSTVKEAAENAEKIGSKNLILIHTEDTSTFGKRKDIYTKEARKIFSGNVFVPDDLEIIEL